MTVLILKTGNLLYCYPFKQSEMCNDNIYTVDTMYPMKMLEVPDEKIVAFYFFKDIDIE